MRDNYNISWLQHPSRFSELAPAILKLPETKDKNKIHREKKVCSGE